MMLNFLLLVGWLNYCTSLLKKNTFFISTIEVTSMTSLLRDAFAVPKTNVILRYWAIFILPRCYSKTERGTGDIYGGL